MYLVFFPLFVLALESFALFDPNPWPRCPAEDDEPWSYTGEDNGPDNWGKTYPECYGENKSPINIQTVEKDNDLAKLDLINYDVPITEAVLENTGRTAEVIPGDGVNRTIMVYGEEYVLLQLHFHWGLGPREGSEHTINDTAYAMEMHLVHMNEDGRLAVVGQLFEESDQMNEELQIIVEEFHNIKYNDTEVQLPSPLTLNELVADNPTSFYRYSGSLTTPNCTEGVTWSVIPKPLPVSTRQMNKFRKLFSVTKKEAKQDENKNCRIRPNFRPIQDLNDRPVSMSN